MAEPKARFVTTTVEVEGRTEQRVVELPAFDLEPWGEDAALTHVARGPSAWTPHSRPRAAQATPPTSAVRTRPTRPSSALASPAAA